MFNLISLLVAAALVSFQSDFQASGALLSNKLDLDNSLQPNVVPAPKRLFRKYVHIYVAPPETLHVGPTQRVQLECQVFGSPSPAVTWLKNGEPSVDYEEAANEILSTHPSSIARITSKLIASAQNGDVFTCLATAGLKQQSASTTVYVTEGEDPDLVLEKLLIPPKPVITAYYNEIFQNMGTNIVLPCRIEGKADLYWQDNLDNIILGDNRHRVLPSGDLMISGLRWSDMGQYTCVAQNAYGKDTASTFLYPSKAS
ncbi:neural/ectodermal development factor IMP-L2-like [Pectinophora gossypiella]|uniref:neural/ectodermal development factor IMP-L2-like n=1 Tax=Pectinophora gossypiella TaxID=13191 RepID=UPI00214E88C9|nr:neural/ectodermal development factor IMP-L2-like [Pectinophora gossypiella]XP_049882338.1 neural/ectodermal development factor IMP-L2-like [Pectinophora gossypiella]